MRILGIDPGIRKTGYGVVEPRGDGLVLLSFGIIKLDGKASYPSRLKRIFESLTHVIEEFEPEQASVETIFYAVNVKSALSLGHSRGAAILSAALAGVRVFEYSPLEIKQALVGYGRATKEQVNHMVKLRVHHSGKIPLDASDALAAAICHYHVYRTRTRLGEG